MGGGREALFPLPATIRRPSRYVLLPDLFEGYTPKLIERLRRWIAAESPSHIREQSPRYLRDAAKARLILTNGATF